MMKTAEDMSLLSIPDLIKRFEQDIRFGCHPTIQEVRCSQAGKELEKRAGKEVISALHLRWKEMNKQPLDSVEGDVRTGITILVQWIQQD